MPPRATVSTTTLAVAAAAVAGFGLFGILSALTRAPCSFAWTCSTAAPLPPAHLPLPHPAASFLPSHELLLSTIVAAVVAALAASLAPVALATATAALPDRCALATTAQDAAAAAALRGPRGETKAPPAAASSEEDELSAGAHHRRGRIGAPVVTRAATDRISVSGAAVDDGPRPAADLASTGHATAAAVPSGIQGQAVEEDGGDSTVQPLYLSGLEVAEMLRVKSQLHAKEVEVHRLRMEVEDLRRQLDRSDPDQAQRLSELFHQWLKELQQADALPSQHALLDSPLLPLMVAQRPVPIAEALAFADEPRVILTPSPPFRIVHANAAWTDAYGWHMDEVAGATMSFLQGPRTDEAGIIDFERDIIEKGYGAVQLVHYRRSGQPVLSRVLAVPVVNACMTTGLPKLTNTLLRFHAVDDAAQVPRPDGVVDEEVFQPPEPCFPAPSSLETTPEHNAEPQEPAAAPVDRELRSFEDLEDQRIRASTSLSSVLDLMSFSQDALILTDRRGRIVGVNRPWVNLCGYCLADLEGHSCKRLQGEATQIHIVQGFDEQIARCGRAEMTVLNYRMCGESFHNHVIAMPILSAQDISMNGPTGIACFFLAKLEESMDPHEGAVEGHHGRIGEGEDLGADDRDNSDGGGGGEGGHQRLGVVFEAAVAAGVHMGRQPPEEEERKADDNTSGAEETPDGEAADDASFPYVYSESDNESGCDDAESANEES